MSQKSESSKKIQWLEYFGERSRNVKKRKYNSKIKHGGTFKKIKKGQLGLEFSDKLREEEKA